MKKKFLVVFLLILMSCMMLTGCCLRHEWAEATCTTAKTCVECGKVTGEPLGHVWVDANCTTAKTCSTCGEIEGNPLGHKWIKATCTTPKTCSVCNKTEGEILEHTWVDATYEAPKTCTACGLTEGEPKKTGYEMIAERGWTINTIKEDNVPELFTFTVNWFRTDECDNVIDERYNVYRTVIREDTTNGLAEVEQNVRFHVLEDGEYGVEKQEGFKNILIQSWAPVPYVSPDDRYHEAKGSVLIDGNSGNAFNISNMYSDKAKEETGNGFVEKPFIIEHNGEEVEIIITGYHGDGDANGNEGHDFGEEWGTVIELHNVPEDYNDFVIGIFGACNDGTVSYLNELDPLDKQMTKVDELDWEAETHIAKTGIQLFQLAPQQ